MSSATQAVFEARWGRAGRFRRPLYDSYGFARLPATVRYLLLGQEQDRRQALPLEALGELARPYQNVVLLFIDAFGWHFFQQFADELPLLRRFRDQGRAFPITAQFPSTTACHVTCIHTGEPVGTSGVFEWYYYEPLAGTVIAPLPFCHAGDRQRDTLKKDGLTAADLFPQTTFYQELAAQGVASHVFQHSNYTPATFSDHVFRGTEAVWPFDTLAEASTLLAEQLRTPAQGRKRYFFLYADPIDHIGHGYGPNSDTFAAEIDATFTLLERLFYQKAAGRAGDTLLLLTADHGQVPVDPRTTLYVNELPDLADLSSHLRQAGRDGEVIRFGGSCRDLFLYVRDDSLKDIQARLARALEGRAEVWPVEELVQQGFFGPVVTERLRQRLGNLVVLPYAGESVYWREPPRFDMHHRGHHGGLTPEEMDTGLYALPL
jgi:hypothetical protein